MKRGIYTNGADLKVDQYCGQDSCDHMSTGWKNRYEDSAKSNVQRRSEASKRKGRRTNQAPQEQPRRSSGSDLTDTKVTHRPAYTPALGSPFVNPLDFWSYHSLPADSTPAIVATSWVFQVHQT